TYAFYLRGGGAQYTISSDQPLDLKVGYSTNDTIFTSSSTTFKSAAPKTSVNRSRIDGLITAQNSQISVLSDNINLRVKKGDTLAQINIEAGKTLIQNDKLLIDATTTVIKGNTWMNGAVIKNASISGAKIANATISSAKIASLDVSKISGNTTNFVMSTWNKHGSDVRITGSGILTTSDDSSQVLIGNGRMQARNPSGSTIGQIGYHSDAGGPNMTVTTSLGAHFLVQNHLGSGKYTDLFKLEAGGT